MSKLVSYVTFRDSRKMAALYEKALPDTKLDFIMDGPNESVMNGQMKNSGQELMFSDSWPGMAEPNDGISPVNFMLEVENCDVAFEHAIANGMTSFMEPKDQFWGDRSAMVIDPEGYRWTFRHEVERVEGEELEKRAAELREQMTADN